MCSLAAEPGPRTQCAWWALSSLRPIYALDAFFEHSLCILCQPPLSPGYLPDAISRTDQNCRKTLVHKGFAFFWPRRLSPGYLPDGLDKECTKNAQRKAISRISPGYLPDGPPHQTLALAIQPWPTKVALETRYFFIMTLCFLFITISL